MNFVFSALKKKARFAMWSARKSRYGVEALRNIAIDWKFGGSCGGRMPTKFANSGATGTSSTDYYQLDKLFGPKGVAIRPSDVLVDVGCGKGRILNYWLHRDLKNRIYGLELDPDLATAAANRLRRFENVSIVTGNALQNLPGDATLFFLFNPFQAPVMESFKRQLEDQFPKRVVRIVYYNSRHANVFRDNAKWKVEDFNLDTFYQAVLITKKPDQ